MTSLVEVRRPLQSLFAGLVEQVFHVDVGICDPPVTDYLGNLLAEFIHVDRIYCLRNVDHEVIRELSHMEAQAALGPDLSETRRRRLIHQHIGDFTLFWAGVYPENLRPRRQGGVDRLREYLLQGKRSYGIAGELSATNDHPPPDVLLQLSDQFECCVHGLHLVRTAWEQLAAANGPN